MAVSTANILDVLAAYDIHPFADDLSDVDLPGIGEISGTESVYSTSIEEVFRRYDQPESGSLSGDIDDPRLREWRGELERIVEEGSGQAPGRGRGRRSTRPRPEPPEPYCAWYCPIHFFGHGWGIYIREACILSQALHIATFVDWPSVKVAPSEAARHLLRSAFYVFFLHEQFHHKVESLGFRLLVSSGSDRYRPYKANVYSQTFLTSECLEESLANAESYRRLVERRYTDRLDPAIRDGLRRYLKASIPMQPPGYREGMDYLSYSAYRDGLQKLQSQVLDGRIQPVTPPGHWSIAPNMITSLADIAQDIYVVLPRGARPLFRPTSVDPGATVSSRDLEGALTRHHGYKSVPGGKGSHVKLKKPGAPTIIVPGNRAVISPGVVKQALSALGGYPISSLPDLLEGRLQPRGLPAVPRPTATA